MVTVAMLLEQLRLLIDADAQAAFNRALAKAKVR